MMAAAIPTLSLLLLLMGRTDENGIQGFFYPWSCEGKMWSREPCGGQEAIENPMLCHRLRCCYQEGICYHQKPDDSMRKKHLWILSLTCISLVVLVLLICFYWWAKRQSLFENLKMSGRLSDLKEPKDSQKFSNVSSHSVKKEKSPLLAAYGGRPQRSEDDSPEGMEDTEEQEDDEGGDEDDDEWGHHAP